MIRTLVRRWRTINSSLSERPYCEGVDRYARMAVYGSSFLWGTALTVRTVLSTSPLALGYLGELVT